MIWGSELYHNVQMDEQVCSKECKSLENYAFTIYKYLSILNRKKEEVISDKWFFKNHRNCSPPNSRVCHGQKPVRWLHNLPLKLNE